MLNFVLPFVVSLAHAPAVVICAKFVLAQCSAGASLCACVCSLPMLLLWSFFVLILCLNSARFCVCVFVCGLSDDLVVVILCCTCACAELKFKLCWC